MDDLQLFFGHPFNVNAGIQIRTPTIGEIVSYGEKDYFALIRSLCATPADRKVEIWKSMHVYWDEINDFDLFVSLYALFDDLDMSILFGDCDMKNMKRMITPDGKQMMLKNESGVFIDLPSYYIMTEYIRKMNHLSKNIDYGVNLTTKRAMIEDDERARLKNMNKPFESVLLPLISSMTNRAEFKYNWHTIVDLPITPFMDAIARIQKVDTYKFALDRLAAGNFDPKKMNKGKLNKELDWLSPNKAK